MIENIIGDLLEADEQYICHQSNCVSKGDAAGIAYYLFKKFPYADCYHDRQTASEPGTIDVRGNGTDQRFVINLHGQFFPGGTQYPDSEKDGTAARHKYFYEGLKKIAAIPDLKSIAFPYRAGCGIAGGNWEEYLKLLTVFEKYVSNKFGTKVAIYQRPEDM